MPYKRLLLLIILSIPQWSASAHDVWLVPAERDAMKLVFGHPGDLEAYDPAHVIETTTIGNQGARTQAVSRVVDRHLVITRKADTVLIIVDYDHGIWTEDAREVAVNKPKHDVPGYTSSVHEKMFAKALLGWGEAASKPTGSRLEILPLANPFAMKAGEELPVQLMFEGAPLAGAELEMLGVSDLFITNREGKVSLPIPDQGFQYILAYHRIKLKDHADTDAEKLSANLTFTVD